jgi:hypothetical protein
VLLDRHQPNYPKVSVDFAIELLREAADCIGSGLT